MVSLCYYSSMAGVIDIRTIRGRKELERRFERVRAKIKLGLISSAREACYEICDVPVDKTAPAPKVDRGKLENF